MGLWKTEFRIVYYHWEYDTLLSFYKDILKFDHIYGWYASPVDRGAKFAIGENRLELICRRPTSPQGTAGMRLQARNIEHCFACLSQEPRVTVLQQPENHGDERRFVLKDPVGNWVEVYQKIADIAPGLPTEGSYFTDEFTAILFVDDLEKMMRFYNGALEMEQVHSWDNGPDDRGFRLRSAAGFTELRQKTAATPQGPGLTTIEANDVDEVYKKVVGAPGVELIWDMEDTWYGIRMFQIRDDEGNVVEAIAYRRNIWSK